MTTQYSIKKRYNKEKKNQKTKKITQDNRRYRNELKQKRKELKEQERINERIANIYDTDTEKAVKRRFKTILPTRPI